MKLKSNFFQHNYDKLSKVKYYNFKMDPLGQVLSIIDKLSSDHKTTILKKLLDEYKIDAYPFYCVNCGAVGDSEDCYVCEDCTDAYCEKCVPSMYFETCLCDACYENDKTSDCDADGVPFKGKPLTHEERLKRDRECHSESEDDDSNIEEESGDGEGCNDTCPHIQEVIEPISDTDDDTEEVKHDVPKSEVMEAMNELAPKERLDLINKLVHEYTYGNVYMVECKICNEKGYWDNMNPRDNHGERCHLCSIYICEECVEKEKHFFECSDCDNTSCIDNCESKIEGKCKECAEED